MGKSRDNTKMTDRPEPDMTAEIAFWDNIAETYAARPVQNMDAYEETLARVRTYLRPDDAVLEVGCGRTAPTPASHPPVVADLHGLGRREARLPISESGLLQSGCVADLAGKGARRCRDQFALQGTRCRLAGIRP